MRNHRKMLIADDRRAVAGGANVAVEIWGRAGPETLARLSFVLEGPAVRDYAAIFAADWQFVTGHRIEFSPPPARAAGKPSCRSRLQAPMFRAIPSMPRSYRLLFRRAGAFGS